MNTCLHVSQAAKLSPPAAFSKVYKEECTLCFAGVDSPEGIDVCLSCFNGGCQSGGGGSLTHSVRHYRKTGHCLVLNIQRRRAGQAAGEGEPRTSKMQKVEILPEEAESQYEYSHTAKCLICTSQWAPDSLAPDLAAVGPVIKGIVEASSAQKRIEVQAWREEEVPCDHTRQLQQERSALTHRLTPRDQCGKCALQENLWLCLVCGAIGCGRRQFDGSGGNGHGAEHYEETGHSAAVKLGTITPEGTADVHCYVCGEMRVDPKLGEHLAAFGIDTSCVERTEKTMAELQLEQNLKFDFSMLSADGHELEPATGPGLRGLKNLGNSCYVSSVVQSLFTLPLFREAYVVNGQQHISQCQRDPAACFTCQSVKLASAIWAGREGEGSLAGIREGGAVPPWMFKAVVASGHAEFATSRQQDASEFLAYLLKVIQRSDPQNISHLVNPFTFSQQQSLTCSSCGHTRHQHSQGTLLTLQLSQVLQDNDATVQDSLSLDDFLIKNFAADTVQASCSRCGAKQQQHDRRMELIGLPEYLIISLSRYVVRNWVPQKIDMAVEVPFEGLDLSRFVGEQKQASKPDEPAVDEAVVAELAAMGFSRAKCQRALLKTDNQGIEAAMNWILEHGDDPAEEESSSPGGAGSAGQSAVPSELIQVLVEAGFAVDKARRALSETGGDVERAFDWILSHPEEDLEASVGSAVPLATATAARDAVYDLAAFISHKGPSIHCGHYIAHIRNPQKPGQWIMCNDERIVVADPQPPTSAARAAYIYIYRRRGGDDC